jgi:hypothetical protein
MSKGLRGMINRKTLKKLEWEFMNIIDSQKWLEPDDDSNYLPVDYLSRYSNFTL